jgi:serine phosphatase RsbU (regulator of sigma subunit)
MTDDHSPKVEQVSADPLNTDGFPDGEKDAYKQLLQAAHLLVDRVHQREEEIRRLLRVTENINRGLGLEEVLEFLYQELRSIIPFNRIGCALIDEHERVIARWARSDHPLYLGKGFRAPLAGSTLAEIVRTGRSRIINDLETYLRQKPQSVATELIVREGMRSSLTCPLVVQGRAVGFLFFSSDQPSAYSGAHVEFFQQIAGQLSLIVEKGRLYSDLAEQAALIEKQNQQFLDQLELARQFQRAMIPTEALKLPGLDLSFVYRPAIQVGGDILDVTPLSDGRALVFIGDSMGNGVEAAMVMAAAKTALLSAVRSDSDPAEMLRRVNEALYAMLQGERFVTAACALIDPDARRVDLALAGHPNPFHYRTSSGEISRPGDAGIPLGLKPGMTFPTTPCPFDPGDALVFFTDGIVEARNPQGELYGDERFQEVVRDHARNGPAELLQAAEASLRSFCKSERYDDDLTILAVQSAPERTGWDARHGLQ